MKNTPTKIERFRAAPIDSLLHTSDEYGNQATLKVSLPQDKNWQCQGCYFKGPLGCNDPMGAGLTCGSKQHSSGTAIVYERIKGIEHE